MKEHLLRLPPRKSSMELIDRLDQKERDEFSSELLEVLWDVDETGDLPGTVAVVLRDWTARAHFADSPVAQDRLDEAQRRLASNIEPSSFKRSTALISIT